MTWGKKKNAFKDYALIGGIALAALCGFLFFTAKGKALKDKVLAMIKPKTV